MTMALNADVRAKLDAHLDAVERALIAAGSSRERRRGVVDDLEAQIMDMLAAKSEMPTVGDLEDVLTKLDPPGAYGQAASGEPVRAAMPVMGPMPGAVARPRYSRAAVAGLVCVLTSLLPLPLILVLALVLVSRAHAVVPAVRPANVQAATGSASATGPESTTAVAAPAARRAGPTWGNLLGVDGCIALMLAPLGLAGTILGWIAFFQIRASAGMLRGRGLALFDGLFYPVLVVLLLVPALVMA
jgi:hypothetical protein